MALVSNTSPVISLGLINQLTILDDLFGEIYIPKAVWDELISLKDRFDISIISAFFNSKVREIKCENDLKLFIDYGESEAILLAKEINASYLLIDDKKARSIAEELGVVCIGTLGILAKAKEKGLIKSLRPLFLKLIENNRYYSKNVLNSLFDISGEESI